MVRSLGPRASQVYEEIRARVLDGRYPPDTQLPAHDELSREFGVALLTVRQAIARLQDEGMLMSLQGRGTFVGHHSDDFEVAWRSLRGLVQSSPLPVYSLDAAGNVRSWNRACEDALGWTESEVIGKRPPHWAADRQSPFESAMRRVLAGETLSGETVLVTKSGERLDISGAIGPLHDADGYVIGTISAFRDISQRKRVEDHLRLLTALVMNEAARSREAAARIARLQHVTAALSRAISPDDVARVVLEQGIQAVCADAGSVVLASGDGKILTVAHRMGYPDDVVAAVSSFPVDAEVPLAVAVQTGNPVWIPDLDEYADHPTVGPLAKRSGSASGAALPLIVEGRTLGAIGLSFGEPRSFSEDEREFVQVLVAQCAQALDRAQVYDSLRSLSRDRDAILSAVPVPIVALDLEGRVTLWSPAAERLTGLTADQTIGRPAPSAGGPGREELDRCLAAVAAGERLEGVPIRRRYPDGTWLDLEFSAEPLHDADGNLEGGVVALVDVTERNRVVERLRESEERFRAVFQSSALPIAMADDSFHFLDINPAYERLIGYSRDELLNMTFLDYTHPEDVDADMAAHREMLAGERESYQMEKRYIRKDGEIIWVSLTVSPLADSLGRRIGDVAVIEDITSRKWAEEDRARLAAIVQASQDAIISVTPDRVIMSWNDGAERIYGYSPDEAIGQSIDLLTPPEIRGERERFVDEVLAGGSVVNRYAVHQRKGGEPIHVAATVSPIRDREGAVVGFASIMRDVSGIHQAEEALRDSEERFRAVFERSSIGINVADFEGRFVDANPAFCEMLGYSRDEIVGKSVPDITYPDDLEVDLGLLESLVRGERSHYELEKRYVRKDGTVRWARLRVSPLRREDGTIRLNFGMVEDITERRAAEEAMRASEQRFRATFEQAAVGIAHVSWDDRFILVNGRLCDMLGYTRDELLSLSFVELTHPDDLPREIENVERSKQPEGGSSKRQKRYLRKDGTYLWVEITVSRVDDRQLGQPYFVVVVQDISEQKQAEDALRASEERYRSLVETSPDAIILADTTGTVVMANQQAARLLRAPTPDAMLGMLLLDLVHPEARARSAERIRDRFNGVDLGQPVEIPLALFDGTSIPAEVVSSTIADEAGRPIALTIVGRDISERKQAQREAEEHTRRLAATVEMQRIIGQEGVDLFDALQAVVERLREVTGADGSGIARLENEYLRYVTTSGSLPNDTRIHRENSLAGHALRLRKPLYSPDVLNDPRVAPVAAHIGFRSLVVAPLEHDGEVIGALTLVADPLNAFSEEDVRIVTLMTGQIAAAISRRRAFEMLRRQLEFTETITESMAEGLMTVDADGRISFVNRAAENLLGWEPGELLGHSTNELMQKRQEGASGLVQRALESSGGGSFDEAAFMRKDGSTLPVSGTWSPLRGGETQGVVIAFRDISEQREFEARIRYQMVHDALTGLPNRTLLHDSLSEVLDAGTGERNPAALLLLDLNGFKDVNNSLGDEFGDLLLREVGTRLRQTLAGDHLLARLGDDEFAILAAGADQMLAYDLADRIHADLAAPFFVGDRAMYVAARIGIALAPLHADDPALLLRRADVAMHLAKSTGRSTVLYSPDRDVSTSHRLELAHDLRGAIDRREIALYYQPKLDLTSGELIGVEALARWKHPQRGFVPPDEFIAVAEQTDLIHPLTYLVLETAAEQCRVWHDMGLDFSIAVNLSARNLTDPLLVETISALIDRWCIKPGWLGVEITETAVMADSAHARLILALLQWQGVTISVDDFGVGQSSLSYLKRLPVDEIKVDRSFVTDIARDEDDVFIVRSVVELGHHLGLHVSAEGVETEEDVDILQRLGCDAVQGIYFSGPLPAADLERWVEERQKAARRKGA